MSGSTTIAKKLDMARSWRANGLAIHSHLRKSGVMAAGQQRVVPLDRRMSAKALARLLGGWHDGGPAYAALSAGIRRALLAGTLSLGTRLPSERELAEVLGLSRTTTTAAYGVLRDEGFAVS